MADFPNQFQLLQQVSNMETDRPKNTGTIFEGLSRGPQKGKFQSSQMYMLWVLSNTFKAKSDLAAYCEDLHSCDIQIKL